MRALTRLDSDCGRVSDVAGVDGVDGEGVAGGGAQLSHHGCVHVGLQIDLQHGGRSGECFI